MTVERDIAGFALPFASGVFAAIYSGASLHGSMAGASVSLTVSLILTITMMLPTARKADGRLFRCIIVATALSTGIFCGFNSEILRISNIGSMMVSWAEAYGEKMQHAIDMIPFSSSTTNAVIKALITGERCDIPKEITDAFRDSGASHILSLSGLHLGIIYVIIARLLSIIGNTRNAVISRSILTVIACGFYTLATGAGASIVRSFLFILIGETARLTHRHKSISHILLVALLIQLAADPASISSVSFQLSYAAMAGIAFLLPFIKSFWPETSTDEAFIARITRKIWDSAAMSISCQLTTAPLAWLYFRSFPMHFLLTNLMAIPLTGLIIPASLITLTLNSIGICPQFIVQCSEALVNLLIKSLEIISTM